MTTEILQLSKMRTFLLWAFVIVWFSEMTLWGVRPLAEVWTLFWQQLPPDDAQLTSALYITHALEATAKGALGVLAVFAIRSRNPTVRIALFIPMALVPPLNLMFQFRAQGFPLGPTTVGTTFTIILWGSFFLFKDRADASSKESVILHQSTRSRLEIFQAIWLGVNAIILTVAASLFLFAPATGLRAIFPCMSASLEVAGEIQGLIHSLMAVGTHVMAISIAVWIATAFASSNPTIRQAAIAASTLLTFLIVILPLREIALELGRTCATSSLLIFAIPLFIAWMVYQLVLYRSNITQSA